MKIAIVSHFRNAVNYLERYFEQMAALQRLLVGRGDTLHLILGYGDSSDGTGEALFDECAHRFSAHLIDVSHGGKVYGSIVHPERFRQLAFVGNTLWRNIPEDADIAGLVESDLIWQADTLMALLDDLVDLPPGSAVAPMVMHGDGRFYDTFAYRRAGVRFTNDAPFHRDIRPDGDLLELDSAGSVLLMAGELARKLHFPEEDVVVGLCRQICDGGGGVWLDSRERVYHP